MKEESGTVRDSAAQQGMEEQMPVEESSEAKRAGGEIPENQQHASKRLRESPEELETDVIMQLKSLSVDMAGCVENGHRYKG